jgi:hypothetical protein
MLTAGRVRYGQIKSLGKPKTRDLSTVPHGDNCGKSPISGAPPAVDLSLFDAYSGRRNTA